MSKDRVLKIDMDFEDGRRQEVVEHIKELYGSDHVSNIITFGTLAARQVIRDVGRVLEVDLALVNAICKTVPAEPKMTLKKALGVSPDFKNYYDTNTTAKEIIDIGMKLEGLSRQKSQHACGIIVANAPISDFVPEVLIQDKDDKNKKNRVAAFNMVEKINFNKKIA